MKNATVEVQAGEYAGEFGDFHDSDVKNAICHAFIAGSMSWARQYDLRTESGGWLGKVILTNNGDFLSVTDYGNLNFHWGAHGEEDFREFILRISVDYFGNKMYQGIAYMASGRKYQDFCSRFAEKILPALQEAIRKELEEERSLA